MSNHHNALSRLLAESALRTTATTKRAGAALAAFPQRVAGRARSSTARLGAALMRNKTFSERLKEDSVAEAAAATERQIREGIAADRARVKAILAYGMKSNQLPAAAGLATDSSMSIDEACAVIDALCRVEKKTAAMPKLTPLRGRQAYYE